MGKDLLISEMLSSKSNVRAWYLTNDRGAYSDLLEQAEHGNCHKDIVMVIAPKDEIIREKAELKLCDGNILVAITKGGRHFILWSNGQINACTEMMTRWWMETENSFTQESPEIARVLESIEKGKTWRKPIFIKGSITNDAQTLIKAVLLVPLDQSGFLAFGDDGRRYWVRGERQHQFITNARYNIPKSLAIPSFSVINGGKQAAM